MIGQTSRTQNSRVSNREIRLDIENARHWFKSWNWKQTLRKFYTIDDVEKKVRVQHWNPFWLRGLVWIDLKYLLLDCRSDCRIEKLKFIEQWLKPQANNHFWKIREANNKNWNLNKSKKILAENNATIEKKYCSELLDFSNIQEMRVQNSNPVTFWKFRFLRQIFRTHLKFSCLDCGSDWWLWKSERQTAKLKFKQNERNLKMKFTVQN